MESIMEPPCWRHNWGQASVLQRPQRSGGRVRLQLAECGSQTRSCTPATDVR
jgi:hypothetical protein